MNLLEHAVTYSVEQPGSGEVYDLLVCSGLFEGVTLTVGADEVGRAFAGSNLVVCARAHRSGQLLGVCRALTDFTRHCLVATVAVAPEAKGHGIGRGLIAATHEAAGGTEKIVLFLHSDPRACGFYEKLGFKRELDFFSLNNVS